MISNRFDSDKSLFSSKVYMKPTNAPNMHLYLVYMKATHGSVICKQKFKKLVVLKFPIKLEEI